MKDNSDTLSNGDQKEYFGIFSNNRFKDRVCMTILVLGFAIPVFYPIIVELIK